MENNSKEAEKACIGSAMTDANSARYFVTELPPEVFYYTAHQNVAKAISKCLEGGLEADVVLVSEKLGDDLGSIGGPKFLMDCLKSVSTTDFMPHYVKVVKQSWYNRKIEALASQGAGDHADEILELVHQREAVVSVQGLSISQATTKVLDGLDEKFELWSLGVKELDALLGGVEPGDLTVLAARTGNGKTACIVSIALKMARMGKRVVLFAGEMGPEQIAKRALANISGVQHHRIRTRKLDMEHQRTLNKAGREMSQLPIHFSDIPSPSLSDIRGLAESFKADVVLVDYLTRCRLPKGDNYRLQVNAFMVGFKNMMRESRRYGILAAQIGRSGDEDSTPKLSGLKESSAIEEEADQVILLSMNEEAKIGKGTVNLNAFVAKNRHGELGLCQLKFNKPLMRVD